MEAHVAHWHMTTIITFIINPLSCNAPQCTLLICFCLSSARRFYLSMTKLCSYLMGLTIWNTRYTGWQSGNYLVTTVCCFPCTGKVPNVSWPLLIIMPLSLTIAPMVLVSLVWSCFVFPIIIFVLKVTTYNILLFNKFFVGLHGDKIYSFVCGNTT